MSRLSAVVDEAVAREDVPFVAAAVADRHGTLFEHYRGPASPGREAGPDTVFRLFSQSKAIGSVGVLILIERGQLTLDTPVASVLPDFADIQVLESLGRGGAVLRAPKTTATVRHLLTHTAGFAYPSCDELMAAFVAAHPELPGILHGSRESFNFPLMFDPGEGWTYGIGPDWAGRVVSAVDGRPIEQFYRQEVLDPLGMHDTVFEVAPVRERLADIRSRTADGHFGDCLLPLEQPIEPEVYGMGQALHGTASDYLRFLRMVLGGGELDGVRILGPDIWELMVSNQIGDQSVPDLPTTLPELTDVVSLFPGVRKTHTTSFVRVERDIPKMRRAGSLSWAGVLNTHYWVDPRSDVAAVFMTQSVPFCESRYMDAYAAFERAVYAELPRLR